MSETLQALSAWYISGCGILLEYGEHQLLVDGIFRRPPEAMGLNDGLCDLPSDIRQQILNRTDIFHNVEFLLFTHPHWDHCDIETAELYSKQYGVPIFCAKSDGSGYTCEKDWVKIENFPTAHDPFSNTGNREHSCFRVTAGGRVFLFTGDMDPRHRPVKPELYDKHIDYLFYNVHHLLQPEGRQLVTEYFKPSHIFIQHLPLPDADPFGLNKRLVNKLKVYGDQLPPCTIMNQPMTKIL